MERVKKILIHPLFLETLSKINDLEKDRVFCRHGMEHLLAVARIGCIMNMKESFCSDGHRENSTDRINDEHIYVAALLHDLGRADQYEKGIPHEQASATIAEQIMGECDFSDEEIKEIIDAILSHRVEENAYKSNLGNLLYKADKASRLCFACDAIDQCKWSETEKNTTIIY